MEERTLQTEFSFLATAAVIVKSFVSMQRELKEFHLLQDARSWVSVESDPEVAKAL